MKKEKKRKKKKEPRGERAGIFELGAEDETIKAHGKGFSKE